MPFQNAPYRDSIISIPQKAGRLHFSESNELNPMAIPSDPEHLIKCTVFVGRFVIANKEVGQPHQLCMKDDVHPENVLESKTNQARRSFVIVAKIELDAHFRCPFGVFIYLENCNSAAFGEVKLRDNKSCVFKPFHRCNSFSEVSFEPHDARDVTSEPLSHLPCFETVSGLVAKRFIPDVVVRVSVP
jgi:hypothetical protein